MGEVLHSEREFRQKQISRLVEGLQDLYDKADSNWLSFKEIAERDFEEAIRRLPEFIGKARSGGYIESLAGGPNHDWIVPLINLLGECYKGLDKESRKAILIHCLNYFDRLRYDYSQNHVEIMESSLLVGDIVVNRSLYWPGLHRAKYFLGEGKKDVAELAQVPRANLDTFWVALAVIWNGDCGKLPIRRWYYQNFPKMVEAAVVFLGSLIAVEEKRSAEKESKDWEACINNRLNKKFDPALHERIREEIKKENWILLPR